MRPALLFAILLLFSPFVLAQEIELQRRPAPATVTNEFTVPDKPEPLTRDLIDVDSPPPAGMVWATAQFQDGQKWVAREVGACAWCARPMTFKQAAFDKKMSLMWIGEIALAVADTEIMESRQCIKDGTCREGNPLLGPSRLQQYGIRMPILFSAWMITAHLRQGSPKKKIGGMKHWWIFPVLYQAGSTAGILANLAR
jgi:hypothetical protein